MEDSRVSADEAVAARSGWVAPIVAEAFSSSGLTTPGAGQVEMQAVCLFVDVAGFSRLTADLASQTTRSAEDVERLIRTTFDRVLSLIDAQGGAVAFIAGDAVLATWTGAERWAMARAARACAKAIADSHADAAGKGRAGVLPVRLCLDAGEVTVAFAGGVGGRWFGVLGGGPILRLAQTAQQAKLGTPFLTAQVKAWEAGSAGAEVRGAVQRRRRDVPEAFLPEWLGAGDGGIRPWLAEYRRASAVIVRASAELTRDPALLQRVVSGFQGVVAEAGGSVLSVQTDDKGLMLMAAWGLAFKATEHDAERAVMAARRLGVQLGEVQVDAAIVVATGDMFAGQIGTAVFRQYSILSRAINAAANALTRAMGDVLCDEATVEAAARRFQFAPVAAFVPKGERTAFRFLRPVTERLQEGPRLRRMVGRAQELEAILAMTLRCGGSGPAGVVRVIADAGIGKSHIATVAAGRMAEAGVTPLFIAGDSLRNGSAFHAWRRLVAAMLHLPDAPDAAAVAAAVRRILPDDALLERLPLLNALLPADLPETAETASLSPVARGQATRELAAAFILRALPDAPCCVLVEDAHWLDAPSWRLVVDCQRARPGIGVLILSRAVAEDDLPADASAMLRAETAQTIRLEPLAAQEIVEVVTEHLGVADLPGEIAAEICDLAEGHPLYAKIAAAQCVQTGRIVVSMGHCHVPNVTQSRDAVAVQGGLRGMVVSQISRLGPAAQAALKAASVEGRVFDRHVLAALLPELGFGPALDRALEELCAAGLVDHADGTGERFRFHHALILDAAYDLLVGEERQRLHQGVALQIEARGGGTARDALLARHWDRAGDAARALRYLDQAAQAAIQNQANREAVTMCNRALALAGGGVPPMRRVTWHAIAGEALRSLGNFLEAEPHLKAVMEAGFRRPAAGSARRVVGALAAYARLQASRGKPHEGEPANRDALLKASRAHLTFGEICYDRQDTPGLLYHALIGMNLALRAGGASAELARGYAGTAMIGIHAKPLIDGDRFRTLAVEAAQALGDAATTSWVYMVASNYDFALGRWDLAEEEAQVSIRAARAAREIKDWEVSVSTLGNIRRLRGHFRTADAVDQEVFESGRDRGVPQVMLWALTGRLKNMTACNEIGECDRLLERLRALYRDDLNRLNAAASNEIALRVFSCLDHLRHQRDAEAKTDLLRAAELYAGLRDPQVYMVDPIGFILDAIRALLRRQPKEASLAAALAFFAKKSAALAGIYPAAQARRELAQGDVAHLRGRADRAAGHWRRAVAAAMAHEMPFDAAMAHHRLSSLPDLPPGERAEHAARCAERLAGLGLEQPLCWTL
jgi:hypothetical protein